MAMADTQKMKMTDQKFLPTYEWRWGWLGDTDEISTKAGYGMYLK